jgi:uncharacterized protein YjbI with pentapeptide repeats
MPEDLAEIQNAELVRSRERIRIQNVVRARTQNVARARTLAVLKSLDGDRKGQVVRFLREAYLIMSNSAVGTRVIEAIVSLKNADLSGAGLACADLSIANLRHTSLGDLFLMSREELTKEQIDEQINEQLTEAKSLVGAILPDGTVMTEEAWEAFKERYQK